MSLTAIFTYHCDFCGATEESAKIPFPAGLHPMPFPPLKYKTVGACNACPDCFNQMMAAAKHFRRIPE